MRKAVLALFATALAMPGHAMRGRDRIPEATPVGETPFVTYEGLPSDHYLWLTGQIARMFRGEIPATDEMPKR